jgi:hypothetical protein
MNLIKTIEDIIKGIMGRYIGGFCESSRCERLVFYVYDHDKLDDLKDPPYFCFRPHPTLRVYAPMYEDVLYIRNIDYYHKAQGLFGPVWNAGGRAVGKRFPCPLNAKATYKEKIIEHFTDHGIQEIEGYIDDWQERMEMNQYAGRRVGEIFGYELLLLIESRRKTGEQDGLWMDWDIELLKERLGSKDKYGLGDEIIEAISPLVTGCQQHGFSGPTP